MRWELIDRFETLRRGVSSTAVKEFTGNEDFFADHFPGRPVVPEPLFIEMIAQAGGVLFGLGIDFKKEVILAKVSNARFSAEVAPPCSFMIEAKIEEANEDGALVSGVVRLKGEKVAEAEILLAAVPELDGGLKKIVFNDRFMKHYDVLAIARATEAAAR